MAHGSTLPYVRGQSRAHPAWRATLRRGVVLGSVTALHLVTMALVLRPMPPYRSARITIHDDDEALRLSFVIRPDRPRPASPPPRPLRPRAVPPAALVAAPLPSSAVTPPHTVAVTPPASVPDGPGDYHSAALGAGPRDAPQTPRMRLPGSDAPPRPGIQLRTTPSLQEVVRVMSTASRCKYERMKMESSANQFVTRQLVERALDADGCGPQAARTAADATIDAISSRAISND
jgi:hypothetical protein